MSFESDVSSVLPRRALSLVWLTRNGGVLGPAAVDPHASVMQVTTFGWCSGWDHDRQTLLQN